MAAADCYDLMLEGPDIHCPRCKTPLMAWNWGGQVLYTCSGCDVLGFNINRAGLDLESMMVVEIVEGAECKGCSKTMEKRESPPGIELYTCSECNVGLFANVTDLKRLHLDRDDPSSCANHQEMRALIGNVYDRLIVSMR